MNDFLKISEAANLALHTAIFLAGNPGRRVSASEIAGAFGASKAHLFKVLQRLVRAGLVNGKRGPRAGTELAKKPSSVSLLQVYETMDGRIRSGNCLFAKKACSQDRCVMGKTLVTVNKLLTDYLRETKLSAFEGNETKAE